MLWEMSKNRRPESSTIFRRVEPVIHDATRPTGKRAIMGEMKIVLVEPEFEMATFLSALMESSDCRPVVVDNPQECLDLSHEDRPDCIIINIMSLADEGISLYLDLKCDDCLCDVPVILLSPISRKTFEQYPSYRKARQEKRVPEPDAFLEIPSETDEIVNIVKGMAARAG
jgi:CheY-like chemotaxis protein